MSERNIDGSWSAWDAEHAIDVHIVTVGGRQDGSPMDAATMLGQEPNTTGTGWIGHAEEVA
jgi:hypothetical protein